MNWLLSSHALSNKGIALIRIVIGILLIIHGTQVFNVKEMADYGPWLSDLGMPFPLASAYLGKIIEVIGGICLVTGMFMRVASIALMATFLFITIVMGDGKILTDAQHPFLFFLFSALFLFVGDSGYSIRTLLK